MCLVDCVSVISSFRPVIVGYIWRSQVGLGMPLALTSRCWNPRWAAPPKRTRNTKVLGRKAGAHGSHHGMLECILGFMDAPEIIVILALLRGRSAVVRLGTLLCKPCAQGLQQRPFWDSSCLHRSLKVTPRTPGGPRPLKQQGKARFWGVNDVHMIKTWNPFLNSEPIKKSCRLHSSLKVTPRIPGGPRPIKTLGNIKVQGTPPIQRKRPQSRGRQRPLKTPGIPRNEEKSSPLPCRDWGMFVWMFLVNAARDSTTPAHLRQKGALFSPECTVAPEF